MAKPNVNWKKLGLELHNPLRKKPKKTDEKFERAMAMAFDKYADGAVTESGELAPKKRRAAK